MSYRSGLVAVVGRPNVGKSTLVNAFVGHKVSIVSDKPQTTRRRALGIATTETEQIIFVDTPGIHEAATQLGKLLNEQAKESLLGVDLILMVVDASRPPSIDDERIGELVRATALPVVLCLNKMDLLKAIDVIAHTEAYQALAGTEESMLTTMSRGLNAGKLREMLVAHLPEQDALYPGDDFTDQSARFMVAELIREKVLVRTRQEVPHAVAVAVDSWEETPNLVRIHCSVIVEKDGQKAILIGRGGSMLKALGSEARPEVEEMLGQHVFLELHVKVRPAWRQNPRMLQELQYGTEG